MNRGVVRQEKIGDVAQPRICIAIVKGDGLVRLVPAGHNQRHAIHILEQQMMQRRIRQHHAQLPVAGGHGRGEAVPARPGGLAGLGGPGLRGPCGLVQRDGPARQ